MLVVWGNRMFGKVDELGEDGPYVATRFFHIWYVPLIPLGSMLVTDDSADDVTRGVDIKLSFKSILFAWARAACILAGIFALGYGAVGAYDLLNGSLFHTEAFTDALGNLQVQQGGLKMFEILVAGTALVAGVLGWVGLFLSYGFAGPSPRRKGELLATLGVPRAPAPETWAAEREAPPYSGEMAVQPAANQETRAA